MHPKLSLLLEDSTPQILPASIKYKIQYLEDLISTSDVWDTGRSKSDLLRNIEIYSLPHDSDMYTETIRLQFMVPVTKIHQASVYIIDVYERLDSDLEHKYILALQGAYLYSSLMDYLRNHGPKDTYLLGRDCTTKQSGYPYVCLSCPNTLINNLGKLYLEGPKVNTFATWYEDSQICLTLSFRYAFDLKEVRAFIGNFVNY